MQKRIIWLDVVRTVAIVAVLWCHAFEQVYDMSLFGWQNLDYISKMFRAASFTFARLGVPLFLLLTGFLVFGKQIENDMEGLQFYKINLLPLFLCTELWIVLYNLFNHIMAIEPFGLKLLIRNLFFLENAHMTNMWYMPMILGIYLVVPFLTVVFQHYSIRILCVPFIIGIIVNFLIPVVNMLLMFLQESTCNIVFHIEYLGGYYGLYAVMGYFLRKNNKNIHAFKLFAGFLMSFFATAVFQFVILEYGYEYNLWYNFLGLFVTAIFLFELLKKYANSRCYNSCSSIFTYISKVSLGLFFLHKPVMICLNSFINKYNFPQPIKAVGLFVMALGISVLIIVVFSKIQFVKKYCFLIKEHGGENEKIS